MPKKKPAKPSSNCAYCGKYLAPDAIQTSDHVVARQMYPDRSPNPQYIQVTSCGPCNSGFSRDEEHFRAMLAMSGPGNEVIDGIWPRTLRGLRRNPGPVHAIAPHARIVGPEGLESVVLYPGEDERVLRTIRKIVRGLWRHHEMCPFHLRDDQVYALIEVPLLKALELEDDLPEMLREEQDPRVFQYRYCTLPSVNAEGAWAFFHLIFYETRSFWAVVVPEGVYSWLHGHGPKRLPPFVFPLDRPDLWWCSNSQRVLLR